MKHLLPFVPSHHCYCEVFGGAASLLFAKQPSKVEIYNDADSDLVAFFRIFHDEEAFDIFKEKCFYTTYSREVFLDYRESWKNQEDPIERVYRWFVVSRMVFNSDPMKKNGYSFSTIINHASQFKKCIDGLDSYINRMRNVHIENDTWGNILKRYDSHKTFFYLDPPYVQGTRLTGKYNHEMDDNDHKRLIEKIKTLKGMVLLSGYQNPIYNDLKWERKDIEVCAFSASGGNNTNTTRIESLWHNYDKNQHVLF